MASSQGTRRDQRDTAPARREDDTILEAPAARGDGMMDGGGTESGITLEGVSAPVERATPNDDGSVRYPDEAGTATGGGTTSGLGGRGRTTAGGGTGPDLDGGTIPETPTIRSTSTGPGEPASQGQ
jgi:hypothetical protein